MGIRKVLYRILKGSFTRRKKRKAIAIAGIILGTAIATALMSVALDVGDKINRELKSYGANIVLLPEEDTLPLEIGGVDYSSVLEGGYLDESKLPGIKDIFWRNNIIGFVPLLQLNASLNGKDEVPIVGTWFNKKMPLSDEPAFSTGIRTVRPYWKVNGNWIKDDEGYDSAMVGTIVAQKFDLKVGDIFEIGHEGELRSMSVKGIVTTGGPEDDQIFVGLPIAQQLLGVRGMLKRIQVSALTNPEDSFAKRNPDKMSSEEYDRWYCTPYVSSIALQLEEAIPNSEAKIIRQVAESEGLILGKVELMMILIALAVLTSSVLGVMSTMTTTVLERKNEIGLMKAIGAENSGVAFVFIVEAIVLGIIGGVFGCGLGILLAQIIGNSVFGSVVSLNVVIVPLAFAISIGIALLGSIVPVKRAIGFDPAVILKGN